MDDFRAIRGVFGVGSSAGERRKRCAAYGCAEPVQTVVCDYCAAHTGLIYDWHIWLSGIRPLDARSSFDRARADWDRGLTRP